jgi:hypothetical protein
MPPPSEAIAPREQVQALTKAIQSDAFEVERIEAVLRGLFRTDTARRAFFTGFSAVSPSHPHVHARDLRDLAEALTNYAVRAARRGDRTRTRRALQAAVDVSLLPTSLVPPEARSGYAAPRSAVAGAVAFIGDALRSMDSTPQSGGVRFEPAQVTVGRIKAVQRHFGRLILAARDEEVLEPTSLELILAQAELKVLEKELSRLRREIPWSAEEVLKARETAPRTPTVVHALRAARPQGAPSALQDRRTEESQAPPRVTEKDRRVIHALLDERFADVPGERSLVVVAETLTAARVERQIPELDFLVPAAPAAVGAGAGCRPGPVRGTSEVQTAARGRLPDPRRD